MKQIEVPTWHHISETHLKRFHVHIRNEILSVREVKPLLKTEFSLRSNSLPSQCSATFTSGQLHSNVSAASNLTSLLLVVFTVCFYIVVFFVILIST